MAIIKIRKEVGEGEEKKIEEKDAWDAKIGLGYPDKTTGKDVINLKITKGSTTTYVPFQKKNDPPLEPTSYQKFLGIDPNAPIGGYVWSTVSNLTLKKDSDVYYPIRRREYIKFKITLNPGPYNVPGVYSSYEKATNYNGAYAKVEILSTNFNETRNVDNYHVVLFGYAAHKASASTIFSGSVMQVFYCALASAKVTNNKGGISWSNTISKDWSSQRGPWDWFNYSGGFLTDTVTLFWKVVESSGSESRTFSINSGKHKSSRGGKDAWIDGNGPLDSFGSYFSYQYGTVLDNPCADGCSFFQLGSDGTLQPYVYTGSSTTKKKSHTFSWSENIAKLTTIKSGSLIFNNVKRQRPRYVTYYYFDGQSSTDLTNEVLVYLS